MPKLREQVAQQPPTRGTVKYNSYPAKRFYRDEDGQHEGDDLSLMEDLFTEDERFYPPRRSNRVERRYYEPTTAAQNRTTRRVTRHTRPSVTPRVLSNTASYPAYRVKQEHVQQQAQTHKHWLFYVGGGMLVSVALWIAGSTAFSWLQAEYENLTYGAPRTFQVDAHVGHQGTSHFIAENLHGDIIVLEIHPSNLAETKIYQGPIFSGNNVDTLIATISFQDVNGDGKPDMVISVGNGRYLLINTGTDFRPTTSSDHIDGL